MPNSNERTELPSEYKQQKARQEGNVKKSQESHRLSCPAIWIWRHFLAISIPCKARKWAI